ncbi:TetR/AcrR family transcriptional regulator [Kutzneria sp. NPDC052558]|uniref:TetR/AcrR family transcriptional regulator n=1 Tax=Kutzneria sp. NPDC052558 TaxID=3364121 RepID=UPI0037C96B1D
MSDQVGDERAVESTRRRLTKRQADTVRGLTDVAVEELREVGYAGLTIRGVAARQGVAPATVYAYFSSKNHLVTEIFWRRLRELPETATAGSPVERVVRALRDIASLVSAEPELAAACTAAMLGDDPDVRYLRERIGLEWRRRLGAALGSAARPEVLPALEISLGGALLHAGLGYGSYDRMADLLESSARLIVR